MNTLKTKLALAKLSTVRQGIKALWKRHQTRQLERKLRKELNEAKADVAYHWAASEEAISRANRLSAQLASVTPPAPRPKTCYKRGDVTVFMPGSI